jgi:hypothetical protein
MTLYGMIMPAVYGLIAGAVVVLDEYRLIGKKIREREAANQNQDEYYMINEVDRLLEADRLLSLQKPAPNTPKQ